MVRRRRRAVPRHRLHRRRERAASRSAGRPGRRQLHRRARRRRRVGMGLGAPSRSGWRASISRTRSLGINEFSVTNNTTDTQRYIDIVALLQAEGLIDTIGVQGHAFSTRVPNSVDDGQPRSPRDRRSADLRHGAGHRRPDRRGPARGLSADLPDVLGAPGRPRHHAVGLPARALAHRAGGLHRPRQRRRAAGDGLAAGLRGQHAAAAVDHHAAGRRGRSRSATACRSSWRRTAPRRSRTSGEGTASRSRATRRRRPRRWCSTSVTTADAGSYDCVVSNAAGSATSATATLAVNKAVATIELSGLDRAVRRRPARRVLRRPVPAGLAVDVTYNGSAAPPIAPGTYAVVATIDDANYIGSATGTLVISTAVLVRHAPAINGTARRLRAGAAAGKHRC